MRRDRRPEPPEKGAPKWMVTFSDLVTLILVIFYSTILYVSN
ncbi:flagellar motor protein MotB [Bacillus coahuilensis]